MGSDSFITQAAPVPVAKQQEPDKIAVSIRNLSKSFGETQVLDNVSLDVKQGEFFSLLGASGCGKTTLLRIIGGFEQPTSGEVLIGGRSVLADPPYRRRTNMIFQHLALFPHLTVAENIAFGLEMKNAARAKIREKVESALELVRLPGFGSRRIDALSGGQKQRVAMARALVNEPDVLLLDEPLGALDLRLRLQMQEELRRLHRATRNTFIFVTHDQGEAMTMSDRIAVMTTGHIAQVGTPREVYEQPAKKFVAEFIGNSNLLIGTITNRDTSGNAKVMIGKLPIACRTTEKTRMGEQVAIVLRYEKVEVLPISATGLPDDLEGKLVSETFMGSAVRYVVATEGGPTFISDMPNTGKTADLQPGARVRIRWSIGSTVVLPE